MNNRVTFLAAAIISGLTLLMVLANVIFVNGNRSLQTDISQRSQQINAANTFAQVYQSLLQALANAAVKEKDTQVRAFLKEQGLQFADEQPAAPAPDTKKGK
ncbi:MAG: hypothetical protein GC131_04610 [Alphaproteobacteria bacterium]|nr:hypothetical protein [Alphaproteobacteria bacterium]